MPDNGRNHAKKGPWRGHLTDIKGAGVSTSFVRELRGALHSLYDWVKLRKSSLIQLFDLEQREGSPSALRHILIDAIESLKPNADVPSKAKAWRTYHLLYSRYTEQFTQKEAATELGLSIRHLRREESLALQTLAAYLWDHYNLESKWQDQQDTQPRADEEILPTDTQTPTQEQELEWLQESLPSELVDVEEVIQAVLKLLGPLARASEVHVDCRISASLPHLIGQLTTIRQALLNVFTTAIRCVPGGQVVVSTQANRSEVCIYVQTKAPHTISNLGNDEIERLEMARQLIELSGGSLEIISGEERKQPFAIKIALPAQEQIPVLAVDDNVDTLQLLQRYLSNSRYRFIGTSDPQQALQLAIDSGPQIIVLDVMLPEVDGWELLGRLHEHPQICDVPIVVCTILPQEQLASSLGAAAFIRKPVSRKAFLSLLDHQLALLSRESH